MSSFSGFVGKTSIDEALADMFVCACDDMVNPLIYIYMCKDEKAKVFQMISIFTDIYFIIWY